MACGDNYSAVVTSLGKLLLAGSLEGGKLGLGRIKANGQYILSFA